jgi:tRNA-dihydrouridine synthase
MPHTVLPWKPGTFPLMLAPMQGVTNRIVRKLYIEWVRPDAVFTEFVRIKRNARKRITANDRLEIEPIGDVPLIVQLIGYGAVELTEAAEQMVDAGVQHLNLNLGCPFGRTTSGLTGGNVLRDPKQLPEILTSLRKAVPGSLSVKIRSGYDNPRQIFELLPLFEDVGIDFLILHPRTVVQKYTGIADHALTEEVIQGTSLPVIANGDINTTAFGRKLQADTTPAGLMLGRGGIADPLLFKRLRGQAQAEPSIAERRQILGQMLTGLLPGYSEIFYGDVQILNKLKAVMSAMEVPELDNEMKKLKRIKSLDQFKRQIGELLKQT